MGISLAAGATPGGAARIKLTETEEAGAKLYHMENAYYQAVFAPAQAMFPLYYEYKPSGKNILVRKPDVAASFRSRDGIQLCLPCVGGIPDRLASKGYLNTAVWETSAAVKDGLATLVARTAIAYNDPLSGAPARLGFSATVTGTAGSSRLQTDFLIENTGEHPARLMFVAHARLAPEGAYREGDYIWAPAERCWISDFQWPALTAAGVTPHSWTAWPIPGMDTFAPKAPGEKRGDFAYAFIPANWLVVGNDRTENFVVFQASEIKIGPRFQPSPYYCVLRRDGDYLLEVGVSRELDARYWDDPEAVVALAPGEKLSYSLHLAAGQGLARAKAQRIIAVRPDRIVCQPEKGAAAVIYLGEKP